MPTPLFSPLTALHRPGDSLQQVQRLTLPVSSPAGLFTAESLSEIARTTHDLEADFESAAEVDVFRTWYLAQWGALIPFWVPSYQQDLVPVTTIPDDATEFDIHLCGYSRLLFPLVERRAIIFLRVDGTFLKRDIEAATENVDEDTETITINEALGEEFIQSNANGVCLLWYGRLVDDVASIVWDTAETASLQLKMIELLDPPLGGSGEGGPISGSFPDPED